VSSAAARAASGTPIVDALHRRRTERGPRVVAIGGGTGLSTLLRGLKVYTSNLTAIVTVADDGGSSGQLRRQLGVPPPGDFRQCIAALAEAEPLMTQLLEYRFQEGASLGGHAFGNLLLVAMQRITGSFEEGLRESSRVLNVRGRILPATLMDVTLSAELVNAEVIHGESALPHGGAAIERVFLAPAAPPAYPEALDAIHDADLVVIGPGSLYTSVLPNLLVPELTEALRTTGALRVYVTNVASQPGETDGYTLKDYLAALQRHVGELPFDYVLVNSHLVALPVAWGVTQVGPEAAAEGYGVPVVAVDVLDLSRPTRHDPRQLAERLSQLPAQTEIAILFGNEQHGLSNEELHRCHWHVQIPADAEYGVLNLAAAVQVISYELRMQWLQAGDIATVSNSWDVPLATSSEIEQLFLHLQKLLLELDFYDPDNPRQLLTRLRRLLLRSGLDRMEVNILRGILAAAMARIDH